MKYQMNSHGGMVFAENADLPQGSFILQRGAHVILAGSLGEHGDKLAAAYRTGDTVQVSTLDYSAIHNGPIKTMTGVPGPTPDYSNRANDFNFLLVVDKEEKKLQRPWNTAMSAPEGVDLECRNNEGPVRVLRKHGELWYPILGGLPAYPPTHWRYLEGKE